MNTNDTNDHPRKREKLAENEHLIKKRSKAEQFLSTVKFPPKELCYISYPIYNVHFIENNVYKTSISLLREV